jgi:hypothetical protein
MSDTLKQIADNLGVTTINGNYLSGIADYYGVDLATSTDLMKDILTEVGGNPATSTDYLQDIVLELGGTVTINGNWMEAWEAITAVAPSAPVNTVAPVISGGLSVGDVLTTTNGTWTGSPTSFTYVWYSESTGLPIPGATSSTYTLVEADADTEIASQVTAINGAGSAMAQSSFVYPTALSAPENLSLPAIDGLTTWMVGMTIEFTGNEWSGNPVPTLTYQWQRDGGNISGATDTTYLSGYADEGYLVGIKCTATNTQGTDFVLSNTVLIEP